MMSSFSFIVALCLTILAGCAATAADVKTPERKLLQGGFVANIVCDATGQCDDGRGGRYYDQNRDDRRRNGDYNNGDRDRNGYNNGYNNYGRKLKQGNFVANIVCDALGSCDDGRGNRYYDQNRDDRRRNGYNNDNRGYDNNRGYNNNRGYDNNRGDNYNNGGNNWGK